MRNAEPNAVSDHFTNAQIHQLRRRAGMRKKITGKPVALDFLRLANHLCQPCETCWHVVDHLSPKLRPRLCDPITDAISRLADRSGWITLMEGQRQALREVRERPYGFAYLVLDEAVSHVTGRAMVSAGVPLTPSAISSIDPSVGSDEFLFWADHLLADLEKDVPVSNSSELTDLSINYFCRLAEIRLTAADGLAEALKCLESIHNALPASTGQPHVLLGVLELEIQVYSEAGRFHEADESYQKALALIGPDQGLRRFEFRALGTALLFQRRASPEERIVAYSSALAELPDGGEPFERLLIAHALSRTTRSFAGSAYAEGLRTWPGIHEALEALEEARPLYLRFGDISSLKLAEGYKADLEVLATELASPLVN